MSPVKSFDRKYGLRYLLLLLILINGFVALLLPRSRFTKIVLHHSASWIDNYASIKKLHWKKHGWPDAAYHLIL